MVKSFLVNYTDKKDDVMCGESKRKWGLESPLLNILTNPNDQYYTFLKSIMHAFS